MAKLRFVHYLNQFFAGVGGEEMANLPPEARPGPQGPASALDKLLANGGEGELVATVFCGDNYAAERGDFALEQIVGLVRGLGPDVFVAGPAFASGRYGLACARVCSRVQDELGIPAVTGMHPDNPGAIEHRSRIYIASTTETAVGMAAAISTMARIATKLARGEELGPAEEEGYIPTGRIKNEFVERPAATRLVDMLLKKISGEPFQTEWPLPTMERIAPAPALEDVHGARIALVTEGGVVPTGNPDRLPGGWAEHWARYDIQDTQDLTSDKWQSVHGGFDTREVNADPDRLVPIDVMRDMEKDRVIGKLHDQIYVTVGNIGYVSNMQRFGREIAAELLAAGVQGVILTGT